MNWCPWTKISENVIASKEHRQLALEWHEIDDAVAEPKQHPATGKERTEDCRDGPQCQ